MTSTPPARLVFFGTPRYALPALRALAADARVEVVLVVSQPDRRRRRRGAPEPSPVRREALALGVPTLAPETIGTRAFRARLRALAPALGVVVAFGRLLGPRLLRIPARGFVNLHASLLPEFRGAAPIQRAVMDGRAWTGVSLMQVAPRLDAGPVYAQSRRAIAPDEDAGTLAEALAHLSADLLMRHLGPLLDGGLRAVPQVEAAASFAPAIRREEGRIDWRKAAASIRNRVRGLVPASCFGYLEIGRGPARYLRFGRRFAAADPGPPRPPGTITRADAAGFLVACGAGGQERVLVAEVQPEGGRLMPAGAYLAGHPEAAQGVFTITPAAS